MSVEKIFHLILLSLIFLSYDDFSIGSTVHGKLEQLIDGVR